MIALPNPVNASRRPNDPIVAGIVSAVAETTHMPAMIPKNRLYPVAVHNPMKCSPTMRPTTWIKYCCHPKWVDKAEAA